MRSIERGTEPGPEPETDVDRPRSRISKYRWPDGEGGGGYADPSVDRRGLRATRGADPRAVPGGARSGGRRVRGRERTRGGRGGAGAGSALRRHAENHGP